MIAALVASVGLAACDRETGGGGVTGSNVESSGPLAPRLAGLAESLDLTSDKARLAPGEESTFTVTAPPSPTTFAVPLAQAAPGAQACSGVSVPVAGCVQVPSGTPLPDEITYTADVNVEWQLGQDVFELTPTGAASALTRRVVFRPEVQRPSPGANGAATRAVRARITLSVDPSSAVPPIMGLDETSRQPSRYAITLQADVAQSPLLMPAALALYTQPNFALPTDQRLFIVVDHGQGLGAAAVDLAHGCEALTAATNTLHAQTSELTRLVPGVADFALWLAGAGHLKRTIELGADRLLCVEAHTLPRLGLDAYELRDPCRFLGIKTCRLTPEDSIQSMRLFGTQGTKVHFFNAPTGSNGHFEADQGEFAATTGSSLYLSLPDLESYQCPDHQQFTVEPAGGGVEVLRQPPRYLFGQGIFTRTMSALAFDGGWDVQHRDAGARC